MRRRIRWGSIRYKIIVWAFVPAALILLAVAVVSLYAYQSATEALVIERDRDLTRLSAKLLGTELAAYADPFSDQFLSVFDSGMVVFDGNRKVLSVEPEQLDGWGTQWDRRIPLRQFLDSSESVYSNVMLDGETTERVVVVVVPITGRQGAPVGWVAGIFRLAPTTDNAFYRRIESLRRGESNCVYLVDGNGSVIYHSNADYIGQDFSDQMVVQQVMLNRSGALRTVDLEGQAIVASFAPVPGTSWGLVTEESWQTLVASSQRYARFLVLLLVLGIVVPVGVVLFGLRRIMRPIGELTGAAQEIAGGHFGQRIVASTGDELEELAAQFNRMANELQSLYDDLEQRVEGRTRELATLNRLAGVVSRSLDLDEVVHDALDEALGIMGMTMGEAFVLDRQTECLHLRAHRGLSDELVTYTSRMVLGATTAGLAAREGRPVYREVADYPEGRLKDMLRSEGVELVVSTPLMVKEKTVGAIDLGSGEVREISDDELSLLSAIGHQIGVAVENARLYDQAQQLAVIEERNRLARDLHDSVMQALYGVTLYAEAAVRQLDKGDGALATDHLREIRDTTEEALREMRVLIFELRPPVLKRDGLVTALRSRLESVEERVGVKTEFQAACPGRLPAEMEEELYRVALEALNNALKHANADSVLVRLVQEEGVVQLEIVDDGIGFDRELVRQRGGFGLRSMEERVVQLGGTLIVDTGLGRGTRIRAEVRR
ncbi:MAG: GAF domain-containing protein [Anaerolineae bacterium]|nr:GAF domain-containing protein [Anaerolineae bacterium]